MITNFTFLNSAQTNRMSQTEWSDNKDKLDTTIWLLDSRSREIDTILEDLSKFYNAQTIPNQQTRVNASNLVTQISQRATRLKNLKNKKTIIEKTNQNTNAFLQYINMALPGDLSDPIPQNPLPIPTYSHTQDKNMKIEKK